MGCNDDVTLLADLGSAAYEAITNHHTGRSV